MIYLKQCIILKELGLAAVQVGILKRILVIDVSSKDEKKEPLSLINPSIKKLSDETSIYEEGCLSIPDTFIEIERPKICEVEYIDLMEKKKTLNVRVFYQHVFNMR